MPGIPSLLEGSTDYRTMVTKMYVKAGGQKGTGMDIESFAKKYFPKMANGGRIGYNEGSMNPDTLLLRKRVEELMDDGYEFGEAVKEAVRELENG
jgi:hypothetical protein|tara:strand:- start:558 stop:842 length:285 start_codon:yes stop_codon:yes gene_type:complete